MPNQINICMIGHLYKIIRIDTGQYYVGVHKGITSNNYWGSGPIIKKYVKSHGTDKLLYKVLAIGEYEYISNLEEKYVDADLLADPLCWNLQIGGKGCRPGKHWYTDGKLNIMMHGNNAPVGFSSGRTRDAGFSDKVLEVQNRPEVKLRISNAIKLEWDRPGTKMKSIERSKKISDAVKQWRWSTDGAINVRIHNTAELPPGFLYGRYIPKRVIS